MAENNMTKELVPGRDNLPANRPALAVAGVVADAAAARHSVADYLSRKSPRTAETQAAALVAFADYLDQARPGLGDGIREYATAVATWAGRESDQVGQSPDPAGWQGVTWGLVEAFVKWLLGQGYAVATVNNRLSAVKVHAKLATKAGFLDPAGLAMIQTVSGYGPKEAKRVNERRPVQRVGDKKAAPVALDPAGARRLKDEHEDTPAGQRDRLLMCLFIDHGLRCSEAARLRVADFDLKRGELTFYRPKVDKTQKHKLTGDTQRAARAYFEIYPAGPALDAPALLASVKGGDLVTGRGMSRRAITKRVRFLGEQIAGVESLSAHDLRHFWATDAARNGTDPFRLQEAGGWSSLAMPRRYVADAKVANEGIKLSI